MDMTALYKISYGLYILGVKTGERDAGCVVDAFIQSTSSPSPTAILCSIQANQTNEAIKQTGEFTVSVLGTDVDPFVIANFGFQSGRAVDKWANIPHERMDGLPILENAAAYLRCRVTDAKELSTHTVFFCEITDARQGEGKPLIYGDYQRDLKSKAQTAFRAFRENGEAPRRQSRWVCGLCGYVYDGEIPFEQLPDSWTCPLCGAPKSAFVEE